MFTSSGSSQVTQVKDRMFSGPPVSGHPHCDKCFDLHCRVPLEPFVCCGLLSCNRGCGARMHGCKAEEHTVLCPNQEVPCLNAHYGCPVTMSRHRLAPHLEVCPASVVACSQEWNRWPITDSDAPLYSQLSQGPEGSVDDKELPLDVAMALRDQELLFRSIKMKNIFPELMEVIEAGREDIAVAASSLAAGSGEAGDLGGMRVNDGRTEDDEEPSQEEREAFARNRKLDGIQNYDAWESMFSKETKACGQTVKNLEEQSSSDVSKVVKDSRNSQSGGAESTRACEREAVALNANGTTGLAPWQNGVLEKLSQEYNIAEYNMYMVHNGAMLIKFGQMAACTPREKDFVYGKLEPIEVQTVRSFNVPTSYRAKRHHLTDSSCRAKSFQQVDTSDLGVPVEDLPRSDEVTSTLLCSLERELRGHLISESAGADGLYVDIGTQTYKFESAPFKTDALLADVVCDQPNAAVHMHLQTEAVTRRHNKSNSTFNFMCGHFFRRDEYRSHFRNVHADVQSCINGWFEQRCPLAYLGCTFTQERFRPSGRCPARIRYHPDLGSLSLQPMCQPSDLEGGKSESPLRKRARNLDPLSRLPFEVLVRVVGSLDGFSLAQLSRVSRLMRGVCETMLVQRGMVVLKWEKKTYSHGGSSWKCHKKAWEFSSGFSSVDRWRFHGGPHMSEHLRSCRFYETEKRSDPVALACLQEATHRDTAGKKYQAKP
ncbi:F-box only protein 40 [Gadus morhua]|uniref:F-box protein 40 n=2 Tax=Gadus morhua TaxID=8049 RepID=A0A8C5CN15_GADMO|nr:F-box only protein 40 [Gadus morhua]